MIQIVLSNQFVHGVEIALVNLFVEPTYDALVFFGRHRTLPSRGLLTCRSAIHTILVSRRTARCTRRVVVAVKPVPVRVNRVGFTLGWLLPVYPNEPTTETAPGPAPWATSGLIVSRARAHSGSPAFRRPSINSVEFVCPPRAIHAEIVKAGSSSNIRAIASCASVSRPTWAKADARQR
jgi:hypothetical protein